MAKPCWPLGPVSFLGASCAALTFLSHPLLLALELPKCEWTSILCGLAAPVPGGTSLSQGAVTFVQVRKNGTKKASEKR